MVDRKYMNLKEVSAYTGIPYDTLKSKDYGYKSWRDKYQVNGFRRGRSVFFRVADIKKVMEQNPIKG